MAQLVKVFDCISRYEWNPYRYPSQFIRLKQENWKKLYNLWKNSPPPMEATSFDKGKMHRLFEWSGFLKKEADLPDTDSSFHHLSEEELRMYFLNELFPLQMKWATSTVSDVSFIDQSIYEDENVTYLLQRFPDIYFVLYYPLFQIKEAIFEAEIILIGPLGIEIIYLLDEDPEALIYAGDTRTWTIEKNHEQKSMLSPVLSLKRNEHVLKGMLQARNIAIPIEKTVVARTNKIISNRDPYNVRIVGGDTYEAWFQEKRSIKSPLKHVQLQALETLLMYAVTTSVRRPEWESDPEETFEN